MTNVRKNEQGILRFIVSTNVLVPLQSQGGICHKPQAQAQGTDRHRTRRKISALIYLTIPEFLMASFLLLGAWGTRTRHNAAVPW